jgi:hypothetical protein
MAGSGRVESTGMVRAMFISTICLGPAFSSDHRRNRFVNRLSLIGDGGLADHEAAVHLAVQNWRAVIIEASHQDGPSLISKILSRLANGGQKGPKRREPFAIVEREKRNVIWQIQPYLANGFQGAERHVLGYRKEG